MGFWLYFALAVSLLAAYTIYRIAKSVVPLLINGIFGLAVFWLLGYFGVLHIAIDWITFLISAIGGVIGVAVVLVLSLLGVPL